MEKVHQNQNAQIRYTKDIPSLIWQGYIVELNLEVCLE